MCRISGDVSVASTYEQMSFSRRRLAVTRAKIGKRADAVPAEASGDAESGRRSDVTVRHGRRLHTRQLDMRAVASAVERT